MDIEILLHENIKTAIDSLFGGSIENNLIQLQETRKEFEGDITLVVFPLLRLSKKLPEQTAETIGKFLLTHSNLVADFNVVKGFLNLTIHASYWFEVLISASENPAFGFLSKIENSKLAMVEYSSPNTNKPLHLGHIRNNLLGYSLGEILKANGNKVVKTNIVNDRGIHICKSMLAWQRWGNGQTPETTGIKGDHLVGDFYVKFDQEYRKEVAGLMEKGMVKEEAENSAPLMVAARDMLLKWEAKDEETIALWRTMNGWVYKGFDVTYKNLGVDFDKIYYESETYTIGRDEVLRGLKEGVFYQNDDNSVWADLSGDKLDQKILLRSDGTSVYMTQDIGTAKMRFDDYPIDTMIYVVGNEQNYHFQVLSILLDKLGYKWGKDLYHFSYGMVELPSGKMKSREGKVVDADDLIEEMIEVARKMAAELGKLENLFETEAKETYRKIALGALKYFILKVDPKKNMLFNPEESIDFNGNTGTFIQYTYARIKSVLRKAEEAGISFSSIPDLNMELETKEKELLKLIAKFPEVVVEAGNTYSPALIANYCYELVKEYNQFYHEFSILSAESEEKKIFRLLMSKVVADVVKKGLGLLGIEVPERM
jgi:arginyl-tRNA synthetase